MGKKLFLLFLSVLIVAILLFAGLLIISYLFPFANPRPFSDCDPNKIIALMNNKFDFHLPDKIISSRAVETMTNWLEIDYVFIFTFTTNDSGWKQFWSSFPKIKNEDTIYVKENGEEYIHDIHDFIEFDPNKYDPHRNYIYGGIPEWYKLKIKKGKYYSGNLMSHDNKLQIDRVFVDLFDQNNINVYIEGLGDYDPNYGI